MDRDNVIFIRDNRSVEYGYSDAWCERANALCKLDRWEEALQAYDKALELCPDDSLPGAIEPLHFVIQAVSKKPCKPMTKPLN